MSKGSLSSEWDDYPAIVREDAHQLLAWSYADMRSELRKAKDEHVLTGLLADGMNSRINDPETPPRFAYYSVHNEKPTSPSGQRGLARPKLDLQIERNGVIPKPLFTFEAKRLRDDPTVKARAALWQYLGTDGVGRFLSGYYVPESVEAAMLGCMQAHDANYWFNEIAVVFASDVESGGSRYGCTTTLVPTLVVDDFPDERVSHHRKVAGGVIRIFHVMIDCR